MPLTRPHHDPTPPPPPVTIDPADVTGMTPTDAHEAILGAVAAGITRVNTTRGMISDALADSMIANLEQTRTTLTAHAPDDAGQCTTDGDPGWPCRTYRASAAGVAVGLGR